MDAVCANFAVIVQGGGGRLVARGLAIHVVLFALGGGQVSIGLGLSLGIELLKREKKQN